MNTKCSVRATLLRLARVFIAGAVVWSAPIVANAQPFAHVQDTPGGPSYLKGQLLVEFDAGASDAALQDALQRASLQPLRGIWTAAMKRRGHTEISVVDTPMAVPAAIALLRQHPAVKSVQPNWVYQHCATSNDPYYTGGSLWGMYGDATSPANQFGSQAGEAWAAGAIGSDDVYVGVIDEGMMITHTDLAANIWTNPYDSKDGVDNDGNGYVDDINGWDFYSDNNSVYDGYADDHGTHVTGTIGAVGGNGTGVAGVNWQVTIISAKFLGPAGGSTSDAIEAIDYFVDLKTRHNLNVVALNNSWGGGGYDAALFEAIGRAAEAGILFIAAAGNAGANNDESPFYPASYGHDAVISVAAIDSAGNLPSFSNYGATSVDLGAPGAGIYSTVPNRQNRSTYASYSGTSMATPHVTGAIALYASVYPNAEAAQIKEALLATATATASLNGKSVTGGRLNVADMLNNPPTVPPTVTIISPDNGVSFASGESIFFQGSASDAQGNDLTGFLVWTADGQPIPGGTGGSFYASLGDGIHTITATVTDDNGATGSASITIGVGVQNDPPVVTIQNPIDLTEFKDGKSISFSGTASDPQDGDLTAALVWTAQLGQGESRQIGTGGSFQAFLCEGTYTITATVTDSFGAQDIESVTVSVDNSTAIVVPPGFDCTDVPSGWSGTLSRALRMQEVYSQSHFGSDPVAITGMAFRVNVNNSGASVSRVDSLDAQGAGQTNRAPAEAVAPANQAGSILPSADLGSAQIRVVLSTTTASPDNLSTTFSQNLGSDATTLFEGAVSIVAATDGSPNGFDIVIPFTSPSSFTYDPAKGNLLVDITTTSPSSANVDASPETTDGASRAYALDPEASTASNRDTGADVIRFELGPLPNQAPTAGFTYTVNSLSVAFTDTSTDSDGSILSWAWTFGDGAASSQRNPSHAYGAAGTYTVSLTVTDNEGATGTATTSVTVIDGSVASLHCGGLAGTTSTLRNTWRATVTVTVHDASCQLVSGAAVQGTWSGGYTGTPTGMTGENGTVSFTTESISNKNASVTFTISGISKTGYTYDPGANHATTITVYKP